MLQQSPRPAPAEGDEPIGVGGWVGLQQSPRLSPRVTTRNISAHLQGNLRLVRGVPKSSAQPPWTTRSQRKDKTILRGICRVRGLVGDWAITSPLASPDIGIAVRDLTTLADELDAADTATGRWAEVEEADAVLDVLISSDRSRFIRRSSDRVRSDEDGVLQRVTPGFAT